MSAQSLSLNTLAPLHVLLVEDSPADARLIRGTLRPPSFAITAVERLSDALAVLRSTPVDVILLDLTLPDSRGLATLQTTRELARGTAVVVLTGNGDQQTAFDAVALGAQDYLVKGSANADTIVRSVRHAFERNRAEEALRKSEERFRALVEKSSDGICLVDREGRILYVSPAVTRILGYEAGELLGRIVFTFTHPDDLLQARIRFAEILGKRYEISADTDLRYRHRDGSWRYLEILRTNQLENPAVRAVVINFRDVTERHVALETAERMLRRYEQILNSIAEGVTGMDLEGNLTFENAACAAMLGWDPPDLIGKPAHETIHHSTAGGSPRERKDCPIQATLRDGVVRHVSDDVFWRKDGTFLHVDYVAAPKLDCQGEMKGVVLAFRDITKQKEMERQVDQAVRVESLGRVAASVAHEFNNILMGIQPSAEILHRKIGQDAGMEKPVRHILDAVRRGRLVSQQILRFASPAAPRLTMLDLGEWLRDFSEEARLALRDRSLEVGPADSLTIRADSGQLSQVMLNLIVNARDASPAGAAITIGAVRADTIPFLRERLAGVDRCAAILVRDRGTGIAPDVLDRIFEPLFTTRKSGGTGLGLAVVQQIVSEHGGKIVVESEAGKGTTFYVVLPIEQPAFVPPEGGGEFTTSV
ncbi:MAG TPA: PAS domain S-box protein [Thermoanaerobaculia bacterium]|nr:PAS domain S-box protein [Thermoanaerobaculia bacterium]